MKRAIALCLIWVAVAVGAPLEWSLSVAPVGDSSRQLIRSIDVNSQEFRPIDLNAILGKTGSIHSVYTFRARVRTDRTDTSELYMGIGVVNNRLDVHWNGEHVYRWGIAEPGRKTSSYQGVIASLPRDRTDGDGLNWLVVQVFSEGLAYRPPEIRIGRYSEIGHYVYLSSLLNLVVPAAGSLASLIMCVFVLALWNATGRSRPSWVWFVLSASGIAISFIPTLLSSPLHPTHFPRVVGYTGMVLASVSNIGFLLCFMGKEPLLQRGRYVLLGICGLYFSLSMAMTNLVDVEFLFRWAINLILLPAQFWCMGVLCWLCLRRREPRDFILSMGFACLFGASMHDLAFYWSDRAPLAWLFPIGYLGVEFAMVALIAMELLALWKQNQERADELLLRGDELVRQRSMADDALRSRAVFLEKMAHEFRTPMQGLMGMVDLLKGGDKGVDPTMLSATERLLKRHLVRINSVIDQMDLRQGSLRVRKERFDTGLLAAGWKQFFRPVQEAKAYVASDAEKWGYGDPERIDRAVLSIGQILSEGLDDMVDVECDHREGFLEVRLSRRHSRAGHLEDRLFGASSAIRQDLDDAIGLAAALGGRLDVKAQDAEVVCVLVFPVEEVAPVGDDGPDSRPSCESPLVLLAEDERINARLLIALLERAGCRAIWARDGQEAIDFAALDPPDLILMDINMPVMDGFDAARILRADPRTRAIPIVAVSAHAHESAILSAGIDGFVAKPVRAVQLRELVDRYCRSGARP